MADINIINVQPEVISLVFSHLIFEAESFSSFTKLLLIWARDKNTEHVRFVLETLNWDKLYHYHHHAMEVTRDQFHGFVRYCVGHNVHQAMFLNSVNNLLSRTNVEEHLLVLSALSVHHFPSHFSFLFFKALFRRSEIDQCAEEMSNMIHNTVMRGRIEELMTLICDMYWYLFWNDHLLPDFKFCPEARDSRPFNMIGSPPLEEDMWNSLCCNAVEGNYKDDGELWRNRLNIAHIWNSTCKKCSLQLIVFRILFCSMEH